MRLLITTVQKLYPSVESFSRDGDTYKAYDKDGKEVFKTGDAKTAMQ